MNAVAPLFGLALAGGQSTRMQRDKAALTVNDLTQLERCVDLLRRACEDTWVSVRDEQRHEALRAHYPLIIDTYQDIGPIAGIAAAQSEHPHAAWLVLACDLPLLDESALRYLIERRDPERTATAYARDKDGWPEPLCAIWEPSSAPLVREYIARQNRGPRKLLHGIAPLLIIPPDPNVLTNVNTPADFENATAQLHAAPIEVQVQYFAIFRERAGKRIETVTTSVRTPHALYAELQARYGFTLQPTQLKVAINNDFRDWNSVLQPGDHVAFIPPVAGG